MHCPLCHFDEVRFFAADKKRRYYICSHCDLVFVLPEALPDAGQERTRYEMHQNDAANEGYRQFLNRIVGPVSAHIQSGSDGLDFGCGPTTLLAQLIRAKGYAMRVYDPFFQPDESVLSGSYDFITATEVVEHLHKPREEFHRLFDMLKPAGLLAVMTRFRPPQAVFQNWYYKNDYTHVCFYSDATIQWIADHFYSSCEIIEPDIVLFRRR